MSRWHVSPAIDVGAYALGWVPALAPLLLFGERYAVRAAVFVAVNVVSEVHRCFTFPYALLEPSLRRRDPLRFTALPAAIALLVLAAPFALGAAARAGSRGLHDALEAATVVLGAWNVYHVLAQKLGLLRLYARRGPAASARVDRAFVFAWLLLLPAWVLPAEAGSLLRMYEGAAPLAPVLRHALRLLVGAAPVLRVVAIAVVGATCVAFLVAEGRANRLAAAPRLWLAGGLAAIASTVFFTRPLYTYLAFAFSHALEYMVFVWAFQRARYPAGDRSTLGRALARPTLAYGGFVLILATLFLFAGPWIHVFPVYAPPRLLGVDLADGWVRPWVIGTSLLHFYYDGVLWKLRRPEVAAYV